MWRSLVALLALAAPVAAEPAFRPVEMPVHVYSGGWEFFVGGGIAVFDCDGDALPEIFAAGGENPATFFRNRSVRGGALAFEAERMPDQTRVTGAYPLDIDNDAITDLVLLRVGENRVLKGLGQCRFADSGIDLPPLGDRWTTAFSATWEAGNALPTLAFGNYVDRSDPDGPFEACDINQLLRPEGDRYGTPIPLAPGFCPLSALFSDWNRQGRADLRLSNDRHYYVDGGEEQLWRMDPVPRLWTEAEGWGHHKLWGMGIASRDVSGDGLPDVFLSSMGDQRLQLRDPEAQGPTFRDAPYALGTTAHRPYTGGDGRPSTGWHIAFGDVTNDGLDDVFITKGNVEQMPGLAMEDPNNLLIRQPDGTFTEKGDVAGVASLKRGRGGALVDFNLDGLLDIAVLNRRAPLEVWQNVSKPEGHWLALELVQAPPNTDAIGAWIEVDTGTRVIAREITVGGGHAGGVLGPEHFGLGPVSRVRVRVIWPGGAISPWQDLATDRALRLVRTADGFRADPI